MSVKWVELKNLGYDVKLTTMCDGINLNEFCSIAHFDFDNKTLIEADLLSLLEKFDIYSL